MIFLALFATLAVAFSAAANMSLRQAANCRQAQRSQLAAESGLSYMLAQLRLMNIPAAEAEDDLLLAVANRLAAQMDGTANLGAGGIAMDDATIYVPSIVFSDQAQSFRASVHLLESGRLQVNVAGNHYASHRGVGIEVEPAVGRSAVFDFGIASKGKITMTGNSRITGVNDPHEADILSATYSDPEAVAITGNCTVGGDIATSNPDSYVSVTGNPHIGGETNWDKIQEHIHIGIGDVEFPEVDGSVFEPFATNIIDSHTSTSGNKSFENIRIKAGTNPTFSGNITIKGVVYIEQPNSVKFTGNLDFTGVVVTEDAGEGNFAQNNIQFTGNMTSQGVENLPDQPQFAALREMPGSFLLAPGFEVKFTGNFGTVNGCMAADRFTLTGNSGGIVRGPIICYGDTLLAMTGNSHFQIDRSTYGDSIPGFHAPFKLSVLAETYREH